MSIIKAIFYRKLTGIPHNNQTNTNKLNQLIKLENLFLFSEYSYHRKNMIKLFETIVIIC